MLGLRKLAKSISTAPLWVSQILEGVEANDVIRRLVQDACHGFQLTVHASEITVQILGITVIRVPARRYTITGRGRTERSV